ncbi:MAG TPA: protein-disulfide reductase DsbD domain-containing protein [Tepidisphaeraceae bacterium]|jgi:thiol:disulfide interchange protein DsbD|nr:protein-disulfide reductase DsbD domain-containing protein [Tepidisphaeraceae bacterium]
MMRFIAILALFTTITLGTAHAASPKAKHVQADLLADVSNIAPGKPFTVGVRLKMTPHWHTYWLNPGDSGQPVKVNWNLPEGFTAGDLRFPVPTRFMQPGDIVGYGYEDEVMLLATLTPPGNLSTGSPVPLTANVSWLVCKDVCIPGRATVALSLPVAATGGSAPPAHESLFQEWAARVPTAPAEVLVDGKIASVRKQANDQYVVELRWTKPVQNVEWFAPPTGDVEFSEAKVEHNGDSSTVTFTARPFSSDTPTDFKSLVATVAYVGQDGNRRGIDVPLAALAEAK